MGSLCSKSSTHSGGHTVLGSTGSVGTRPAPGASSPPDPRAAAAAAAERRQQAEQARGTHAANPKRGHLAAQVGKTSSATANNRKDDRLVWD
ncbi:hypothetical protein AB1N83_000459 [Pleurotus pulmonarius]|nr:hypothetical protein EYR36_007408 [Pleurotus pulmonarius]